MEKKFRKKPLVITAYQTDVELVIPTLEGDMHTSVGDWIITGIRGEKYPIKDGIFQETYDEMEDEVPTEKPGFKTPELADIPRKSVKGSAYEKDPVGLAVEIFVGMQKESESTWKHAMDIAIDLVKQAQKEFS